MREIKYRQPLFHNGHFRKFHYWGDIDGGFQSPVAGNLGRNSQEFTGLLDKNGKEIYEGDVVILRCHVSAGYYEDRYDIDMDFTGGVVILPSMGACIKNPIWVDNMDDRHGKNQGYKNIRGYRSEVIGNIYENPELISPKTDSTPNRI